MNLLRFIYVMNPSDKEKLELLGYELLKCDDNNSVFVFENKNALNFSLDDVPHILSDVLTF